jgi:hypothetical protein
LACGGGAGDQKNRGEKAFAVQNGLVISGRMNLPAGNHEIMGRRSEALACSHRRRFAVLIAT